MEETEKKSHLFIPATFLTDLKDTRLNSFSGEFVITKRKGGRKRRKSTNFGVIPKGTLRIRQEMVCSWLFICMYARRERRMKAYKVFYYFQKVYI